MRVRFTKVRDQMIKRQTIISKHTADARATRVRPEICERAFASIRTLDFQNAHQQIAFVRGQCVSAINPLIYTTNYILRTKTQVQMLKK